MALTTANHYVPVLRWKRGERVALRQLQRAEKALVIPLIEPVLLPSTSVDEWIDTFIDQVAVDWGEAPLFLDCDVLLKRGFDVPTSTLIRTAAKRSLKPILVVTVPADTEDERRLAAVRSASDQGVCIRLTKSEIRDPLFDNRIRRTVQLLGRRPQDVDVVVDYKVCAASDPSFSYVAERLPHIESWRSVVALGGSFPKDLTSLSVGQHDLPRLEWVSWSQQVNSALYRVPSFGDYTTQHAIYYEPPEGANVSASVRYTSDSYWVVMRGEGLRNKRGPGFAQYPATAELLMARKEYCGSQFSFGDFYVWQIGSRQISSTGNPETWLRAGINHHIVFAVRQVSRFVTEQGFVPA